MLQTHAVPNITQDCSYIMDADMNLKEEFYAFNLFPYSICLNLNVMACPNFLHKYITWHISSTSWMSEADIRVSMMYCDTGIPTWVMNI